MVIDVTYAQGEPPRAIRTSGESLLSGSTMAGSPEWRGTDVPACAVMLRPRLDLVERGEGLVVEVCAWSTLVDPRARPREVEGPGGASEVPRLALHVFRAWEILSADELAGAVSLDVDGTWRMERLPGSDCLCDVSAFLALERQLLSSAERGSAPLAGRVALVVERLRAAFPGVAEEELCRDHGVPGRLLALARGGGRPARGKGADDGLGDVVEALASAADREARVRILKEAILDMRITTETLGRALRRRHVEVEGLDALMDEAFEVLDRF